MSSLDKKRFMINFDLDTKLTKEEFGKRGTSPAYAAIKKYLEANGFEHRQYSGYISHEPMSEADAYTIVEAMYQRYPWLYRCVQCMDISEIGQRYDLHAPICAEHDAEPKDIEKAIRSLSDRVNKILERASIHESYEQQQDINKDEHSL